MPCRGARPGHLALACVTATFYVLVECCGAQAIDLVRSFGIPREKLTISPEHASLSPKLTAVRSGSQALPTGALCKLETAFSLAPCTSKSDQFGEEHCPFPSILPYDGLGTDAAAGIRDIELEQPCAPDARRTTPLFCDDAGTPYSYAMLHNDLRALLTALYGKKYASAFSWHSIRIGLACALCAADAPDAVIQLICRWASPDSLKVYRQMGIEKNIFWVSKAHSVTFDATRVNNIPALDRMSEMQEQSAAFAEGGGSPLADWATSPSPVPRTPLLRPTRSFTIPGGTVQAHSSDAEGLVGLSVLVPRSYWTASDVGASEPARIPCVVAAECAREFCHPDGTRSRTYLLEWRSQYFPIKRESLLRACLTASQRASLH